MNALELKHVTKHYTDFMLNDVSFSLPSGCILGLIGENGAGKSTTIHLILNMLRRDGGDICVLGRDNRDRFEQTKQEIGVVLDEACFPESLTARQVDAIMRYVYSRWDSSAFSRYLRRFSLPEQKPFKDFSRGMKMKLAIAVALSHEARLLILDEATSGLDPVARDDILEILYDFTRDETHSILISSHIVSDLEKLCDYIAFLREGRLLLCEEKDRLLERYGLLQCDRQTLQSLSPGVVSGVRESAYGVEAMVDRTKLPRSYTTSRLGIEDIIVFLAKGGRNR